MRALLFSSLAALALLACGSGRSVLVVSITSGSPVGGIHHFHVIVTSGGQNGVVDVPLRGAMTTVPPAQSFGLGLGGDRSGSTAVEVQAVDASGTVIAHAAGTAVVRPGETSTLALSFTAAATGGLDGGGDAGGDGAAVEMGSGGDAPSPIDAGAGDGGDASPGGSDAQPD